MKMHIKSLFFTGLLIFVPLAVTIYVLSAGFEFLDGILRPFIIALIGRTGGGAYVPGVSLLVLLILITLLGAFARFTIGERIVKSFEGTVMRIPIAKSIYSTVKHASSALITNGGTEFMGVVLVEYPKTGTYAIGFTTAIGVKEIQDKTEKHVINVFVPTTPNPTSGFLLMVPENEVIKLNMSVENGMKLIISGGFSNIGHDTKKPS